MKKIRVLINTEDKLGYIHPEIYGHFSEHLGHCIYGGIFVGEDSPIPNIQGIRKDVIEAFKGISMPVLRWPGGCFAEEYHWMDGIGPKEERKHIINTNWGGVTEDNSFGTHEFMKLCELVGCKPYVNANLGSGTVQEMAGWVEYMTSDASSPLTELRRKNGQADPWKLEYLGIGNENWGCGGNMKADDYANVYRRYQSFCHDYSGNHLKKIASGPNSADYDWMETLMKSLCPRTTAGIDLHYYTNPTWPEMGSATEFDDKTFYATMNSAYFADELLTRHIGIMDRYDPDGRIGLVIGEWGCWHQVEPGTNPAFLYQQNTMRDALVAGIELNIFNRHSRRVMMANLAQTVNVLQSVILTDGEKLIKTPTYHVFDLYQGHQGGNAVYCHVQDAKADEEGRIPMISASASVREDTMTVTLTNCSLKDKASVELLIPDAKWDSAKGRVLTQEVHAYNDSEHPNNVKIKKIAVSGKDGVYRVTLPACSVVSVSF